MNESTGSTAESSSKRQKRVQPSRSTRGGSNISLGHTEADKQILTALKRKWDYESIIPEDTPFLLTTDHSIIADQESASKIALVLNPQANYRYFDRPEVMEAYRAQKIIETPECVFFGEEADLPSRLRHRGSEDDEIDPLSDSICEKRFKKYEGFEKRLRLREKEKLKHEHYKLKERMEELRTMDSAAFLSLPASSFSKGEELNEIHDLPPDFALYPHLLDPELHAEGERRRDEMLTVATQLETKYRLFFPSGKTDKTRKNHLATSAHTPSRLPSHPHAHDKEEEAPVERQQEASFSKGKGKEPTIRQPKLPQTFSAPGRPRVSATTTHTNQSSLSAAFSTPLQARMRKPSLEAPTPPLVSPTLSTIRPIASGEIPESYLAPPSPFPSKRGASRLTLEGMPNRSGFPANFLNRGPESVSMSGSSSITSRPDLSLDVGATSGSPTAPHHPTSPSLPTKPTKSKKRASNATHRKRQREPEPNSDGGADAAANTRQALQAAFNSQQQEFENGDVTLVRRKDDPDHQPRPVKRRRKLPGKPPPAETEKPVVAGVREQTNLNTVQSGLQGTSTGQDSWPLTAPRIASASLNGELGLNADLDDQRTKERSVSPLTDIEADEPSASLPSLNETVHDREANNRALFNDQGNRQPLMRRENVAPEALSTASIPSSEQPISAHGESVPQKEPPLAPAPFTFAAPTHQGPSPMLDILEKQSSQHAISSGSHTNALDQQRRRLSPSPELGFPETSISANNSVASRPLSPVPTLNLEGPAKDSPGLTPSVAISSTPVPPLHRESVSTGRKKVRLRQIGEGRGSPAASAPGIRGERAGASDRNRGRVPPCMLVRSAGLRASLHRHPFGIPFPPTLGSDAVIDFFVPIILRLDSHDVEMEDLEAEEAE